MALGWQPRPQRARGGKSKGSVFSPACLGCEAHPGSALPGLLGVVAPHRFWKSHPRAPFKHSQRHKSEYSSLWETRGARCVQPSVLAPAAQSRQKKAALTGRPRFPAHAGEISQEAQPAHRRPAGGTRSGAGGQAADLCPTPHWGQPHRCPLQEELRRGMRSFSQEDLNH